MTRVGLTGVRSPPTLGGIERPPHVVDETVRARGPEETARRRDGHTPRADVGREQKAGDESRETEIGHPDMRGRKRPAVDRMAEEAWKYLIADAEDHHHHKADEVHVSVGGTIDDPRRMNGHGEAEGDASHEPQKAGANERFGERIHGFRSVGCRVAIIVEKNESSMDSPLGLASRTVRVVPYNPLWAELYAAEFERLSAAAADAGISLVLEHIGSTAVVGLSAKPVLDILAGRDTDAHRDAVIAAIAAAGYSYRGEQGIVGRDFFRRGEPRQYHVHLAHLGSEFWTNQLLFRDYLRAHDDVARAYGELKRTLAVKFPNDREAYINGKTEFVRSVIESARG